MTGSTPADMVLHSQRLNEPPLQPWVIISSSGQVDCAHCTCMAGIAESCTHVGALLFKVEAAVRIRGTKTVTDVPAYWMMPGNVQKINGEEAYKIDFSSAASKKKKFDHIISGVHIQGTRTRVNTMHPCEHSSTLEDLKPLLDILHSDSKAVCLSGMKDYCQHYVDPVQPQVPPKSLLCLRDKSKDGCDLEILRQHCEGLLPLTTVSGIQAIVMECKTRGQHQTQLWYSVRAGRITASNIHAVTTTSIFRPALSTIKKVCYPQRSAHTAATKWGVDHEDVARQAYINRVEPQHTNLKVQQSGFVINPSFPEVGASPDGLINCSCCGKGCLEIKCPFLHKNNSIQQACEVDCNFCLRLCDGLPILKREHPYYSQVQTQIFVTESNYCDFAVWTLEDLVVLRLLPDHAHWRKILVKAQEFFLKVCLPELVGCYFTKITTSLPLKEITQIHNTRNKKRRHQDNTAKVWCLCQGSESLDDMVACDNENCKIQWFHFCCVGLGKGPSTNESWLCPECRETL